MKKFAKYALLLLSVACLSIGVSACGESESSNTEKPPKVEQTASLSVQKNMLLTLGDEQRLVPEYTEISGKVLSYVSSNPSVATVSDSGLVEGMGEGTATITVSYGKEQATCEVSVSVGSIRPTFAFEQIENNEIVLSTKDKLNLASFVTFNGKTFFDHTVEYAIADPTIAKVENGELIPLKTGETTVSTVASWRGLSAPTLEYTFTAKITNSVELYVNDGKTNEFTLYTNASFGGESFATSTPFVLTATENGSAINGNLEIVEGEEFVSYQDGTLTAITDGEARIRLYCTSGGEEFSQFVKVNVKKPLLSYAHPIDFDATDGTLPLAEIFGKDVNLVEVIDFSGEELTLENNKISGFEITRETPKARRVDVYSEEGGYTLNLTPYTKVIRKAEDLKIFNLASKDVDFSGYYVLAHDIDAKGYSHVHANTRPSVLNGFRNNSSSIIGLTGVFDGRGHVIDGLTVGQYGLFGKITSGTIKNVAFTDVKFRAEEMTATLAACLENVGEHSRLENIYVQAEKLPTGERSALLLWQWNPYYTEWNNVVAETPDTSDKAGTVSFTIVSSIFDANLAPNLMPLPSNVFVVSPTPCSLYGGNDTGAKPAIETVSDANNQENAKNYYKTWKRYETYGDFRKDVEKTAVSGFDTEYWTLTNGVPTWKGVTIDTNIYEAKIDGEITQETTVWEQDTFKLALLVNGEEQTDVRFVIQNAQILSVDGSTFTALRMGTTTVEATCEAFTRTFTITVNPVGEKVEYAAELLLDTSDGTLYHGDTGAIVALDSVLGGDSVISAMDMESGKVLTLADGKLSGYVTEEIKGVGRAVVVKSANKYAELTVTPYTKVLDEASELALFKWSDKLIYFDGVYALAKDLDASSYTHNHQSTLSYRGVLMTLQTGRFGTEWTNNGLTGTFDGRGHTIDGITLGDYGLFGAISGGTVKNVGFTNVKFTRERMACVLAVSTRSAETDKIRPTLENLYVQADTLPTGEDSGFLAWALSGYTIMKNVILVTPDQSATVGSFAHTEILPTANPRTESANIYVISPTKLTYYSDYGNDVRPYKDQPCDASNQTDAVMIYSKIKRYATEAEMKAAGNDYSAFSEKYWTIANGVPVWKTAQSK